MSEGERGWGMRGAGNKEGEGEGRLEGGEGGEERAGESGKREQARGRKWVMF